MKYAVTAALAVAALAGLGSTTLPASAEAKLGKQPPQVFRTTPPPLNCLSGFTKTEQQYYPPNQHGGFAKKLSCVSPQLRCAKPAHAGLWINFFTSIHDHNLSQGVFKAVYQCEYVPTTAQAQPKAPGIAKMQAKKQKVAQQATQPISMRCFAGFNSLSKKNYPANIYNGHPRHLHCVSPQIKCPKPPKPDLDLWLEVSPIDTNSQQGTFKLRYTCHYS